MQRQLQTYFPKRISYKRFIALCPPVMPLLFVYLNHGRTGKRTGVYYPDSKKLPVCDNRRIHQNKVFRNLANRGQSSTGWFYGFNVFTLPMSLANSSGAALQRPPRRIITLTG
jgi:hypothetical protein